MAQLDRHTAQQLRERLQDLEGVVHCALSDINGWLEADDEEVFDVNQDSLKRVVLSSGRFSSAWVRNRIR